MSANIEVVQMDVAELSRILQEHESELDDTVKPATKLGLDEDEDQD